MSQYSLSTTDPLRKGPREQARKVRLPWRVDNGVRKQQLYDGRAASLIFDAGTVDTKSSSRANTRMFWSRKHTPDASDDTITPTQGQFGGPPAVFGGAIFESPPVSRAGTTDAGVETPSSQVSSGLLGKSDTSPHSPTLARSGRDWKMPSPLFTSASRARYRPDCDSETEQQPATPTTPSALTRMLGIFSRR